MESRSSESNYGFSGYSGGYSSESSYASESRNSYSPSPSFSSESALESRSPSIFSSESRQTSFSSESRGTSYEDWLKTDPWIARGGLSSASEMHEAYQEWLKEQSGKKNIQTPTTTQKTQYNSLDDIDKLIERLEASLPNTQVTSERVNQVISQQKQKIEALKQLVVEAKRVESEEIVIRQLEQENSELDAAIDSMVRRFRK